MATSQSTIDTIKSWYSNDLGRAADQGGLDFWASAANSGRDLNSLKSDFLSAATKNGETVKTGGLINSAPTPSYSAAQPTASSAPSSSSTANVGNWYRSALGRDADASGKAFWESAVKTQGADKAYQDFLTAARRNNERVTAPASWAEASTYIGPTSGDASTAVDEWGRNVLGRDLTADELQRYSTAYNDASSRNDIAALDSLYSQFLSENSSGIKNNLDRTTASQLNGVKKVTSPSLLDPNTLARRTIDPRTETVAGQMDTILAADSPYLQQARARAQRVLAGRGLINSTMAGTAGEDAAIAAALNIATPDAAAYLKAGDYNTALTNQALMYNADTQNKFASQQLGIDADWRSQQSSQSSQMSIAQLQADTSRFTAQLSANTARYNTDMDYRRTMNANLDSLINNILMQDASNMSPDRKAALLESLGVNAPDDIKARLGTSARRGPDGKVIPGTGLAGAVYVIDSVAADLSPTAQSLVNNYGGGS